jgi:hypothetical protein
LDQQEFNATADVPGTFQYDPPAGTVLTAGNYTLTAIFTPTDATTYMPVTTRKAITVYAQTPTVTWPNPASIATGVPLCPVQLNATASAPGTFAYTPGPGTVLPAGVHVLSATFTPTDTKTYGTVTAQSQITVMPTTGTVTPTVLWGTPAAVTYGTALGAAQLNATASVPGTFTYSPAAGTVLTAGAHALTAVFTPTDTTTYSSATSSASITVSQATPVITWSAPATITNGTALSAAQLNATASVPGSFAYSPSLGTVLSAGAHALTAVFTPTDAADYTPVTSNANITVGQGAPTITWSAPATIAYGAALSATQLNATASVPGTFVYTPATGTVLSAGAHTLTAVFTPTDTTTYSPVTSNVSITVTQGTPVITWNAPASIVTNTALGANQLNATASVPGSFVYSPAAGTQLTTGTYPLSLTFTPNDTTNYAVVTATNSITVTASGQTPTGPVVNITAGMSTSAIQSALNGAPSGATISFAAGNYSITSKITVPCANLQLTGPVSTPPTAKLSANYTNDVILGYNGGCATLGSVSYLAFANTGAIYFAPGNNSNFTFEYNTVSNLPSNQSNVASQSGLFFDGAMWTTLSNVLIKYNTFGDANSCSAVFALATDQGGYCAGVITSQGVDNNIDIENNVFRHVEEGVHFNQLTTYNPGQVNSVCVSCKVDYNYIVNYHRIGIEIQNSTPTNSLMLEHNAVIDPLNSSWGTFAVSLACCQSGYTIGVNGFSPALIFNDNLLIASQPCGAECPPYGVEFWGTGSQGTNSLIEGSFSNGYTWGFGASPWAINNNYICGPNYPTQGAYIANEEHQTNTPAESGNVTAAQCQTTQSTAPTISPSGGSFSTSQVVTLSDAGPNTGIWYTTDGSTPTPGSGTAKYYTGPLTISATTTIKAVGMWGSISEPASYPAGYGYVPSTGVSATLTKQ